MSESTLRLVAVYPELLGTYGDGGNILVLEQRLRWRGLGCDVTRVSLTDPIPRSGDLYVLGGGEDDAQVAALDALRGSPLVEAVDGGAHAFGVCAGLQILGTTFTRSRGKPSEGLGLLDVVTDRLQQRAIGEVVVEADSALRIPALSGFENHSGRSVLSRETKPLGRVLRGVGNGGGTAVEGAVRGRVLATYLHGPVLARNPALADLLLERVLGRPLAPLDEDSHSRLRQERLQDRPDTLRERRAMRRLRRTLAGS